MENNNNNEIMENPIVIEKRGVPLLVFIICIFLALIIGGLIAFAATIFIRPSADAVDQNKLNSIKMQIDEYYKGDYDEKDMVEGAYRGYVEGLGDEYSNYMTREDYKKDLESYSGEYSGIGITFNENENGSFEVADVTEGSPAEKSGVEVGDQILTVNGKKYRTTEQVANHIRGEKGTEVTIEFMHDGEIVKKKIKRANIHQETVKAELLDNDIAHIKIASFIETTSEDFDKALDEMTAKGAKSLILDLRNNGGGLVDQCVEVADQFLDKGVVTYVEDKKGKTETYDATDGKTDLKTVVLVNEYSASASEILSYALKDNGYTIIGEKTFGKGVIQVTLPQADGSALQLTIMEYLSPDKHRVHKKGVKPDIDVEDDQDTEVDEQLEKAKDELSH